MSDKPTSKPSIRKLCPTCGQVSTEYLATECSKDGSTLVVFPQDALIGTTIVDRYHLLSLAGEGGWSAVYKADDLTLERTVAVKVMQAHLLAHADRIMRFKREAMAISAFAHANMRAVYDCGVLPSGQPFMVMEYLDGQTLSEVIKAEGALSVRRVVDISIQVCDVLQSAHKKNIIHRDVKPSNIMLVSEGEKTDFVKVMDFGLAKFTDSRSSADLTTTGETVGTAAYMSPEQCLGKNPDPRSDIYSLGCVIYEAVTGRKAFDGQANQCMLNHINQIPLRFSEVRRDLYIPQFLESIVFKALQKNPADRFASPKEMADALKANQNIESTITPTTSMTPSLGTFAKKNALLLAAATLTLSCLVYSVAAVLPTSIPSFPSKIEKSNGAVVRKPLEGGAPVSSASVRHAETAKGDHPPAAVVSVQASGQPSKIAPMGPASAPKPENAWAKAHTQQTASVVDPSKKTPFEPRTLPQDPARANTTQQNSSHAEDFQQPRESYLQENRASSEAVRSRHPSPRLTAAQAQAEPVWELRQLSDRISEMTRNGQGETREAAAEWATLAGMYRGLGNNLYSADCWKKSQAILSDIRQGQEERGRAEQLEEQAERAQYRARFRDASGQRAADQQGY